MMVSIHRQSYRLLPCTVPATSANGPVETQLHPGCPCPTWHTDTASYDALLSEIEMKRNMIFFSTGTSYFIVVGRVYQQQKMQKITWQKTQLKNVKSLVLCVEK
jgi:hypothetical protein